MADATSFTISGAQTAQPAETREPSHHLTFFSLPALFQKNRKKTHRQEEKVLPLKMSSGIDYNHNPWKKPLKIDFKTSFKPI